MPRAGTDFSVSAETGQAVADPARLDHDVVGAAREHHINSLVQAAKAKARGYRSTRNLKAIIYLLAGKLDLRLPE